MKEFILQETSVWRLKCRIKDGTLLNDYYFDFSKMPNLRVHAGILLKEYRKEANLTQEQLAVMLKCKRHDISNWELNSSGIHFDLLIKVGELCNKNKEQVIRDIEKNHLQFSERSKPLELPYNFKQFYIKDLGNIIPHLNYRVYSFQNKKAKSIKVLNNFLNTFFEYEKEVKIKFPLTSVIRHWSESKVDLAIPISVLFLTEGSITKLRNNIGFIFLNNSRLLHDLLVDCIYYRFGVLPTSYFRERERPPKNSIYITEYNNLSHKKLVESILRKTKNIKTAPHENQTSEEYLRTAQPNLNFILKGSLTEKIISFSLFLATEGSVYISERFGFIYPVVEIGCTNPTIIDFLEKLSNQLGLNFKKEKSKKTWSGIKGVRARGIANALKLLKMKCFIKGIKITAKSKYYEGFDRHNLLLSILEFHKRQEEDKELFNLTVRKINEKILEILNNKEFKYPNFYIKHFEKKGRVKRWL